MAMASDAASRLGESCIFMGKLLPWWGDWAGRSRPAGSHKLAALLLGAGGADRRLDLLDLLRRRQHRGETERIDPQFPGPSGRVVQVVVLVAFDFLVGGEQHLGFVARGVLADVADQLPVQV